MISGNQVAHQGWLVAMAGTMTTGVSLIAWCAAQVAKPRSEPIIGIHLHALHVDDLGRIRLDIPGHPAVDAIPYLAGVVIGAKKREA